MASSGTVKTNEHAYGTYYTLNWSQSRDYPNNRSKITWNVKFTTRGYFSSNAVTLNNAYINGTKVSGSKTFSNISNETVTLASGSLYVAHTSSGTKTMSLSLSGSTYGGNNYSGSASVTLESIPRYTITYNANGGEGAPGNSYKYYNQTIKLSTTIPTRTGYEFLGWGTSSTGGIVYYAGGNYSANASDTLYAVWSPVDCIITYDTKGGTPIPQITVKYDSYFRMPTDERVTRHGYVLTGWSLTDDNIPDYDPYQNYRVTGSVTLYACWDKAYMRITFQPNEGVVDPAYIEVLFEEAITELPVPTKKNFDFLSWYYNADFSGQPVKIGDIINNNITVYAKWRYSTNCFVYIGGEWKRASRRIYVNGEWKNITNMIYVNGEWRNL